MEKTRVRGKEGYHLPKTENRTKPGKGTRGWGSLGKRNISRMLLGKKGG